MPRKSFFGLKREYFVEVQAGKMSDKAFNVEKISKKLDMSNKSFLEEVLKSDVIHLGGGNTYYFLKHLRKSKMLGVLKKYVKKK